jgi:hypothetical protein
VARVVIVIVVAAAGVAAIAMHAAGSRLPVILLGALGALIVITAVGWALLRGATHHAVVAWSPPRRTTWDEMLPLPAAPRPAALPAARKDPFTADGIGWAELIEQAEREELLRQGPREARVIAPGCEGPGCPEHLDGNPWQIRADTDGHVEEHSFCSRECAESWRREREASRR